MKKFLLTTSFLLLLCWGCCGQVAKSREHNVAIKTNLLYDATANINVGVEVGLAWRWSLEASSNLNMWSVNGHNWKHWFVQPEARYWFRRRFMEHFLGFHAIGGEFNFSNIRNNVRLFGTDFSRLSDYRYQGLGVGAGIAYGYALRLGTHWNMEFELGVGYIYTRYDRYECVDCNRKLENDVPHHYIGPTKAAINLVYLF